MYLSVTDKTRRQTTGIDIKDPYCAMNKCYLIDIHRKLQSITSEYRFFFSLVHIVRNSLEKDKGSRSPRSGLCNRINNRYNHVCPSCVPIPLSY